MKTLKEQSLQQRSTGQPLGFLAFGFCLQFDKAEQLATLTALVRAQVGYTGSAHSWVGTYTHILNKQW